MGDFTPSLDGALVLGLSDEIEGEVAHHGHVVSAVADPEAREVLFEGDVENPMNAVLDAPMTAHRIGESLGRKRDARRCSNAARG